MKNQFNSKKICLIGNKSLLKFFLIVIIIAGVSFTLGASENEFQQEIVVSGTVIDRQTEEPIPGVSIILRGTTRGTVTDTDGNYRLENVPGDATLVFSFVGMITQQIPVENRTTINVSLVTDAYGIEEVVAVGYGVQQRANLTGSVASVRREEMEQRTTRRSSNLLQGTMSGIQVRQASGNPTEDAAGLLIRGRGTFSGAGTSPLILVDGVETSINNVDPNDIESVSILKDAASAAIFGSKAANGVILVTTRSGERGDVQVSYNGYIGTSAPTMIPEMVNSWEYAEIVNEAYTNVGGSPRYTDQDIENYRQGAAGYHNFDHIDYLFTSGRGLENKHNVSFRGGSAETQYLFSAGYNNSEGIIMKNWSDRYNLRLNVDSEIRDNIRLGIKVSGYKDNSNEPNGQGTAGTGGIVRGAMRNSNTIPGFTEDGYYGRNESLHPEADLHSDGFIRSGTNYFYTNTNLDIDFLEVFTLHGQVGYVYNLSENKTFNGEYWVTPDYWRGPNSLRNTRSEGDKLVLQSTLKYNKWLFDNTHNVQLLLGGSSEANEWSSLYAYRDQFPSNLLHEISAGSSERQSTAGSRSRYTLASFFGRANYNIDNRFLLEANFRYDGSSRFPEGRKYGFFPSFSVAWRMIEESWFPDTGWLSDLKFRGSWGQLGNQSIGNYPYQSTISLGQDYPFGGVISPGAAVTTLANRDITWETTTVANAGLDLTLFSRLFLTADYYVKETDDILYNVSVSRMLGAWPSATNAGKVENKGLDLNLSYRNVRGDFSYGISSVFSFVHNQVLELYGDLEEDISRGLFVGHPIGSSYGYLSDGLIRDEAELETLPTQPFAFLAMPGGIKYLDIDGPDGEPDGRVTSGYDRTVIGKPLPITTYALNLNLGYRNFDFRMMFQGEGGRVAMNNIEHFFPLDNDGNVHREAYENRWHSGNQDPNASYPAIVITTTDFYRQNMVDFWFRDATFIRLKNVQVSYNLPDRLLNSMFINRARIYVTGENLFTLSGYYDGYDPEMAVGGARRFYPITRLFAFGGDIDF